MQKLLILLAILLFQKLKILIIVVLLVELAKLELQNINLTENGGTL